MNLISTTIRTICLATLLSASVGVAMAQYVWTDTKGSKQYSDQPPPSSVPSSHILKRPGGSSDSPSANSAIGVTATRAPVDDDGKTAPAEAAVKTGGPMTLAERNADYQKRKIEQAEKDKKAVEAVRVAAEKSANCDKAQSYGRALEDGMRISTSDKSGEGGFMSDDERAAELKKNQRVVKGCK